MSTLSPRVPTARLRAAPLWPRWSPSDPATPSAYATSPQARRTYCASALISPGLGHHLQPVVQIGKDGISDGVVAAIDIALDQHELLKLRLSENAPGERRELATELAERCGRPWCR